jgi:hypothetical protein
LFGLQYYAVDAGVKESKTNVKLGILDLKFQLSTLTQNNYYAFEAKRINKYADRQDYYIDHGIQRFVNRKYYPESNVTTAGMIGFVEVDAKVNKNGQASLNEVATKLADRLKSKRHITTQKYFEFYELKHNLHSDINHFKHSYVSSHIRTDKVPITIHHLLLDYYSLLLN